jgi:hypothetical protein
MSTGGGIFVTNGAVDIMTYLNNAFNDEVTFQPTILLPYKYSDEETEIKELKDDTLEGFVYECENQVHNPTNIEFIENSIVGKLYAMYNDREKLKTTYNQRYPSPKKTDIKEAELYDKSKANFNIVMKIVATLGTRLLKNIIFFPLVTDGEISPEREIQLYEKISDFTIINTSIPTFTQKRLLIDYTVDSEKNFHHITIDFNSSKTIPYTNIADDENFNLINRVQIGKLYSCPAVKIVDKLTIIKDFINIFLTNDKLQANLLSEFNIKEYKDSLTKLNLLLTSSLNNYNNISDRSLHALYSEINKTIRSPLTFLNKKGITDDLTIIINDLISKNMLKNEFTKKDYIQIIIFPEIFKGELGKRAHISHRIGEHKPDKMKIAAETIYKSFTEKDLETSIIRIDTSNYYFNTLPSDILNNINRNIDCNFHGIFYL